MTAFAAAIGDVAVVVRARNIVKEAIEAANHQVLSLVRASDVLPFLRN